MCESASGFCSVGAINYAKSCDASCSILRLNNLTGLLVHLVLVDEPSLGVQMGPVAYTEPWLACWKLLGSYLFTHL